MTLAPAGGITTLDSSKKKVLWFNNKKEAIEEIKANTTECCDLEVSNPYLFIYTKLHFSDNNFNVIESNMK